MKAKNIPVFWTPAIKFAGNTMRQGRQTNFYQTF